MTKKLNEVKQSERYRITINSRAINTVLKPMPPTVRSGMIQIALSHWIMSPSGKDTLKLMKNKTIPGLNTKRQDTGISGAILSEDTDLKKMFEEAAGDF